MSFFFWRFYGHLIWSFRPFTLFSLLGKNFTPTIIQKSLNIWIEICVISRSLIFHDFIDCKNPLNIFYEEPAKIMHISTTYVYQFGTAWYLCLMKWNPHYNWRQLFDCFFRLIFRIYKTLSNDRSNFLNTHSKRVCHKFILKKQVTYFRVDFDHF